MVESITWRRKEETESSQSVQQKKRKEKEPGNNKPHVRLPDCAPGKLLIIFKTDFPFFFKFIFILKDNCFTDFFFFWFSVKPQHESAIGIHTYIPSLLNVPSLPSPSPSYPSRLIQSPYLSFLSHTANSLWLSILHMVM